MPLPPDLDRWFAARTAAGFDEPGSAAVQDGAWLSLPTGRVVATDPVTFGFEDPPPPFAQAVPAGRYRVTLLVADGYVAAARLVIRDEPAATWEAAVPEGRDSGGLDAGESFTYDVEAGVGCFTDDQSLRSLCVGGSDWQQDLMLDVADGPTAATVVAGPDPDEDGEPVLVAFRTGEGDGEYPTWVGRNANGDVACFVTDFMTLTRHAGGDGRLLSPGTEMVEAYGGGTGFRFKIRNVKIDGRSDTVRVREGGMHELSFDLLHDCSGCGNAVNQLIVGLAGQARAQASVWNGKQRSGGGLTVVNPGTDVEAMAEDNPGPAEWVNVSCDIVVPDRPGAYSVRARYAQAYQGRLMTAEGRAIPQPEYQDVLGWWKVDRPDGPGPESAIGTIIVES
jgi:Protein of unknown function (DUF4241)